MRSVCRVSLLLLALAPSPASGDPPKVQPRIDVKVGSTATFSVVADKGVPFGYATAFDSEKCTVVRLYSEDPEVGQFLVIPQALGEYRVVFWTKGETKSTQLAIFATGPTPPSPPGPGPGPGPGPQPPNPNPIVPISGDGLRVLYVVEFDEATKYPPGQNAVMYGEKCRAYLNAKCVRFAGQPQWYVMDQHAKAAEPWATALKRPRTSLPWVLISTGKDGYEGPVPGSEAEALTLFEKYGGALAVTTQPFVRPTIELRPSYSLPV